MRNQRKKIWIDAIQTRLFVRIGAYFVMYQIAVWAILIIWQQSYSALQQSLGETMALNSYFFPTVILLFLGFLFIYDSIQFAHRIVGPLYRFRKTVQAITAGDEVELVRLRQGDYLLELRDEFNAMLKVLEERGAVTLKPTETRAGSNQAVTV